MAASHLGNSPSFILCKVCAESIRVDHSSDPSLLCGRCGHRNFVLRPHSAQLALAFTLTALIFYIPANIFPFMTIELYGNRNSSTIWGGIVTLVEDGSWPIALIVFLASMLIPLVKLVVLFYLALTAKNGKRPEFKTRLYHFIEGIGRWSMLDIFLLSVLVAVVKLGPWTTVEPDTGALLFALVVIFTMLASNYFDPKLLWNNRDGKAISKSR